MGDLTATPDISVIVPARNEEACLADCLRTLVGQAGPSYEIIVVDDHSTDRTRAIAEGFAVRVAAADTLPAGWSGKCNAAWSGARVAKGSGFSSPTPTRNTQRIPLLVGLQEAQEHGADLLSYSPKQEVRTVAERALMPVIFAELATTFPPQEVSDPASPIAAANGQYLLIHREVYDAVGGHAAVATTILEDVELAKAVKRAGYKLRFRLSDVVSTRMYRSFPQMWEGWTKNLALLFPNARGLALRRMFEFAITVGSVSLAVVLWRKGDRFGCILSGAVALDRLYFFWRRIRRAHFDWLSNVLAFFGLPVFSLLLLNSSISHKRGSVRWKGRQYGKQAPGAFLPPLPYAGEHGLPNPEV